MCATLFLGESFGGLQALGALVLLSGAVLAVTRGRLPRPRRPSARQTAEAEVTQGSD
ncbi:hypothetical protein [Streptomyces sp. NPDC005322]|uniref:hypothetical protein n=1 Tax=Streptomyces sp. NPDC005322 TaxID=3157032 RepID=UPI0033AACB1F